MAVIQFSKQELNKDACLLMSWGNLAWHTGAGTSVTCAGSTLTWNSGAHGLLASQVGAVQWMAPTGGTAGLYQLTTWNSATSAVFTAVGFTPAAVSGVTCAWGDVGSPYSQPDAALDRTLQCHGTFGASGNLAMYGSNDSTNWAVAKDNTGTALNVTNVTVRNVFDGPLYYSPMVTGGDGTTNLNALLLLRIQLPRPIL